MLNTLIFDWDGTLHNTEALYGRAFRKAYAWLAAEGYAPKRSYTDREVSIYLGMSAPEMWNTFMPELPQPVKDTCSSLIGQAMVEEIDAGKALLYPGAPDTLTALKEAGYRLVFLSNCKHAYMEAHRRAFGLDRWFDGFYCCQDYDFRPKVEIFPAIRDAFPAEFCVIGDRASDLETARVHGLASIGCAYGFGSPEELAGADRIARRVTELPGLIQSL